MNLEDIFNRESPRLNPRKPHWPSLMLRVFTLLLFLALIVQAFFRQGLASWSVGIVYIIYDTCLLAFTAWHIRKLCPAPIKNLQPQSLTVIIAAHNEANALPITLSHLFAQSCLPQCILIADDGSRDSTAALLARDYGLEPYQLNRKAACPLLWLPMPHQGKARALNTALAYVETTLVLTIDADTLLTPHALAHMQGAYQDNAHLVAATGVLAPLCDSSLSGRFFEWFQGYEYIRNFISRYAWSELNSLLLISGAFAAFRTQALRDVGGFDPECLVEDYELIHRLQRHSRDRDLGWQVGVVGGAQAQTDAPSNLMSFMRQRRRWFAGFLQTQHWNRDMIANGRYGALGRIMLPVKTLDTLQPLYGIAAFVVLLATLALGLFRVSLFILYIMLGKTLIDLSFHLWSLGIYRRWTGGAKPISYSKAIIAAFCEPFSFQLLRHTAAAWGWWIFLSRTAASWGKGERGGIARLSAPQPEITPL
jgi:cellulose synthase/poly-beta-1,6-N-acetylglucosamine synthase-like glycosyltransferase